MIEKLQTENRTLSEPLAEARVKVKNLERQVQDMKKAKSSLLVSLGTVHKQFFLYNFLHSIPCWSYAQHY